MMINAEKEMKMNAIINTDETLAAELATAESIADVCELFARRGLELTEEEVTAVMCRAAVPANGELGEDDLDDVSGGGLFDLIKKIHNWLSGKNTDDMNDIIRNL